MSELLFGVDIGTASSKAVLARPDGTIVASATRPHSLSLPKPGWAEHDPEDVWLADFTALCDLLVRSAPGKIAGVAVSGVGPCLAPVDRLGRSLRPAILYGIDNRSESQWEELAELLGPEAILARGGSALSSQALGPKLLWLHREEPEVWARMARWHMASSFIVEYLTGEWALDHHSASQCNPFYDLEACEWAEDWLGLALPDLPLPRLAWSGEVVGTVTEEAAARTGLAANTPVTAGTIDAWAEAVSVGVRSPGDLMLMYGSTMFVVAPVVQSRRLPAVWTTRGVDPGSRTLAAGMATAGSAMAWFRDLTHGASFETLGEEARSIEPGADGLLALPYFAGERTPIFDPRARGAIVGLTLRHGRAHLYRALLESTAYGVRQILAAFGGSDGTRAIAVGGGTADALWPQIVSDVTGLAQRIPRETIGASYGNARLAAEAVGLARRDDDWIVETTDVQPDLSSSDRYDALFAAYSELYPATIAISHALADMQLARATRVPVT